MTPGRRNRQTTIRGGLINSLLPPNVYSFVAVGGGLLLYLRFSTRLTRFWGHPLTCPDSGGIRNANRSNPLPLSIVEKHGRGGTGVVDSLFVGSYGCGLKSDLAMAGDYLVCMLPRHGSRINGSETRRESSAVRKRNGDCAESCSPSFTTFFATKHSSRRQPGLRLLTLIEGFHKPRIPRGATLH